jgi:DNA-binding phage protein
MQEGGDDPAYIMHALGVVARLPGASSDVGWRLRIQK